MKKCPHCAILNTDEAEVCDCGFVFAAGRPGTPATVTDSRAPHQNVGILARAWRGEERLWKVWWYIGAPIAVLDKAVSVAISARLVLGHPVLSLAATSALLIAYLAWCVMAWNCAPNVNKAIWTPIARIVITLGLLRTAAQLVSFFQPSSQSP